MSAQIASAEGAGRQRYPLSEAPTGLWYAQRLSPAPAPFNTAHGVGFEGALAGDRFRAAADAPAA
ncbi:hypothetical protein, partial [Stenotrophomonas sp. SrG]|uniref:hypothetical protein n=1 Tax=Stenotrophomonas sp. SrG TaxID=3414430 RepID=UPI003CEE00A6